MHGHKSHHNKYLKTLSNKVVAILKKPFLTRRVLDVTSKGRPSFVPYVFIDVLLQPDVKRLHLLRQASSRLYNDGVATSATKMDVWKNVHKVPKTNAVSTLLDILLYCNDESETVA